MAGRNNHKKGKGPPPLGGVYVVPLEGEKKQPGIRYPDLEYSPALAEEICNRMAHGNSLTQIETLVGMPCRRSVTNWAKKYPEFADALKIAEEMRYDAIAEQIRIIADTPLIGEKTKTVALQSKDDEGNKVGLPAIEITTGDNVERSKLMIYARTFYLSHVSDKFRDKAKVEMTGKDGAELKPFTVVISSVLDRDKKEEAT